MTATSSLRSSAPLPLYEKAALAAEVVTTYVAARRALRHAGLRDTLAELRRVESGGARVELGDPVRAGRRLGRIVTRTLAVLPADGRCLSQSLVLTRMLARRGVQSRLVIAVKPGEQLAAHAWVEYDGVALLAPGSKNFEELVTL